MSIRSVSSSQLRKILHTTDSFPFTLWLLNIRFSLIQPCCLKWFERVQKEYKNMDLSHSSLQKVNLSLLAQTGVEMYRALKRALGTGCIC